MNEIKIDLNEVNSQEFFGNQNSNITKLRTYFPKIKIIARGSTLKAYGEENILEEFSKRTDMLLLRKTTPALVEQEQMCLC